MIEVSEQRIEALTNIERSQEKQKKRHDMKEETIFKIGDKVLLKDSAKEKQWSKKLTDNWKGPYYIYEVYGKRAYKIQTIDGKILKATQNVKNLKKYYNRRNIQPRVLI